MEKKFLPFEFKVTKAQDDGKTGIIEGYASTFGNVDLGDDIVEKGAFTKTIKDRKGKFPILLDHDPTRQIGWNVEASEDDHGLLVKGEIQLITEEAKNRYALAKRAQELGTKMGLSIGYRTIKWDGDPQRPSIRKLKELQLYEYSFVTFPMNPLAGVDGVKAVFDRLQKRGYDLNKLENALAELFEKGTSPAAQNETDPEILQSVDRLINLFKA